MKVCLAGSGHGGKAALISLQNSFDSIEILSTDSEIRNLAREEDIIYISNSLESISAGLVVCAGYMQIVPNSILESKIIINTHPSLLPKYRGLHALAWAIINGESKIGFSVHLMNENIDDGPILKQWVVENNGSGPEYFLNYFDECVRNELGGIIRSYLNGDILPKKQNKLNASWVSKRTLDDCKIDFFTSNKDLKCFFQALQPPYPRPFFYFRGEQYTVTKVDFTSEIYTAQPGKVVNIDHDGLYVKTLDSCIILKQIFKNNRLINPRVTFFFGAVL